MTRYARAWIGRSQRSTSWLKLSMSPPMARATSSSSDEGIPIEVTSQLLDDRGPASAGSYPHRPGGRRPRPAVTMRTPLDMSQAGPPEFRFTDFLAEVRQRLLTATDG